MQVTIKQQAAEIERLKADIQTHQRSFAALKSDTDALQAKLSAMGNTEPVAWMDEYGNPFTLSAHKGKWYGHGERNWKPLYTAPKAQPDDSDINQVHEANAQVTYAPIVYYAAPKVAPLTEQALQVARLHFGYAQGHYMGKCIRCDADMDMVDKRCHVCVDCADKAIAAHGIGGQQP